MTAITFDTHFYIKRLKDAGVAEPQAEAVIDAIRASREIDLGAAATKGDLKELELRLENKIKDLQIKLGAMLFALGGILIAVKFFS